VLVMVLMLMAVMVSEQKQRQKPRLLYTAALLHMSFSKRGVDLCLILCEAQGVADELY